jgi:hypothetical protein
MASSSRLCNCCCLGHHFRRGVALGQSRVERGGADQSQGRKQATHGGEADEAPIFSGEGAQPPLTTSIRQVTGCRFHAAPARSEPLAWLAPRNASARAACAHRIELSRARMATARLSTPPDPVELQGRERVRETSTPQGLIPSAHSASRTVKPSSSECVSAVSHYDCVPAANAAC